MMKKYITIKEYYEELSKCFILGYNIELITIRKYIGKLEFFMEYEVLNKMLNSKIIFLPLETQNLLAPLIGILKGISKEDENK